MFLKRKYIFILFIMGEFGLRDQYSTDMSSDNYLNYNRPPSIDNLPSSLLKLYQDNTYVDHSLNGLSGTCKNGNCDNYYENKQSEKITNQRLAPLQYNSLETRTDAYEKRPVCLGGGLGRNGSDDDRTFPNCDVPFKEGFRNRKYNDSESITISYESILILFVFIILIFIVVQLNSSINELKKIIQQLFPKTS